MVVCFNPPAGLEQRLQFIAAQVDLLIVWDNASDQAVDLPNTLPKDQAVLLRSQHNIGIAAALNRGLAHAMAQGAAYAVLFDHDSVPMANMVATLRHALQTSPHARAAATAPCIRYALPDIKCRWPQTQDPGYYFKFVYAAHLRQPTPVDLAISSGMLLNLEVWKKLGGFDESLFIDLVDTEYCLLMRSQGYKLLACPGAELQHSLGDVDRRKLGNIKMFPTHHSAMRHFYINRNRWVLTERYGLQQLSWLAYEWLGAAKLMIKTILFEPQRGTKLLAMLKGNWQGLRLILQQAKAVRHDAG